MRRVSIRELRIRASELVRAAEDGETIVVQRRGKPVAELSPLSHPLRQQGPQPLLPDMSEIWNSFPQVPGDSGKFLEQDR